ncbi:hypothetical protein C1645_830261, partial [Glomus cerebriforme]
FGSGNSGLETFGSENSGSEEKHSALGIQNSETYTFAPGLGKPKRKFCNVCSWTGETETFAPGLEKPKHSALKTETET